MEKLLLVEDGGKPILTGLRVKDPSRPSGCIFGDTDCMVDPKTPCDKTGVVYKITCNSCSEFVLTDNTDSSSYCEETYNYIGCTRSSIHSRMLGHKRGQKSKLKSNPLYRHDCDYHSGEPQQYTTTIVSSEK